jgi:diadenosine tetraphosphate (Ap4A) HIT family hydrolase
MIGVMDWLQRRAPLDMGAYLEAITKQCFFCAPRDQDPGIEQRSVVLETPEAIAFLDRYPVVFAHVLVAPLEHREDVIGDFTEAEYLALQRVVRRVGAAVQRVVPCERLYILSLGSAAGNSHVHWHLVPCPPGLPFERQQISFLRKEEEGYIDVPDEEMEALAAALRDELG